MSSRGNDGDKPLRLVRSNRGPFRDLPGTSFPGFGAFRGLPGYLAASLVAVLIVALFRALPLAAHVHVNIWWFESIGLGDVYGRTWSAEERLFLVYGFVAYLAFTIIFFVARGLMYRPGTDQAARWIGAATTGAVGLVAAWVAIAFGYAMASQWEQYLLASHAQSFGITDPIHHRDIGFYVFTLPWRETLGNFGLGLLILGGVELAALAILFSSTSPYETRDEDIRRFIAVGCLFGAALFGFLAWRNFFINPYDLNRPGTAYGGGATFTHSSLWWYPIVGIVEIMTALVLLGNVVLRRGTLAYAALLPVLVGLAATAGQGIFQKFVVSPNELSAESRYLGYSLSNTRHAYGIDQWHVREYTPRTLARADVSRDAPTVRDARIADNGAFTQVMRQRQENRTFYAFNTADIDRYTVDGKERQVLLAARELDTSLLSTLAQNWVNEHVKFTHGYGLTMAPANTVTPDGQPLLWIQNVPVQETVKTLPPVRQPRLYFGEFLSDWALVHSTTSEFDYSAADRDAEYHYTGPDGVTIGSSLRRLTLAWVEEGGFPFFDRLNISGYVRPSTRIVLHRNIFDRVRTIAPWLILDSDPYLVLRKNGSLVWMLDGMTSTDDYPYSERIGGSNYRRNSVKIVLDAYTGRTTFYAFGHPDPILKAWSSAFPGMIHPFSSMPSDLRAHIKYPDDFLMWQARAYRRYHVTNVTSYYNGDNEWDIETSNGYDWDTGAAIDSQTLAPVWTVARLFGEAHDSFFSILPFSVRGKAPMAGYIAADNNSYRVTALDMPRGAQTTGVSQFESLYQQAPTISSTLTLLDQRGSQVVPGQILILPVGKALLYIRPLYLRSAGGHSLPQLIRVVVGTQNEVNWGFSLQDALKNLLTQGDISTVTQPGTGPGTQPSGPGAQPTQVPTSLPSTGQYAKLSDAQLIALASHFYAAAQATPSLSEKDRDLRKVGQILQTLHSRHPH